MKKIVLGIMLFLVMLIFVSCATKKVIYNNKIYKSNYSSNTKFEYFYRGFATIKENMIDSYPHGTLVIQTDEDWHDLMDRYVPGIPYYASVDYTKECLVFDSVFPAKSIYSIWADIKTFIINGNKLEPEYISGMNGIQNGIYAQNSDGAFHCFVNIVKINKSDIPENIENIYHKGDVFKN